MRHTPGPWSIRGNRIEHITNDTNHLTFALVATINEGSFHLNGNRSLILAAPDLLQACRATLLHMYDGQEMDAVSAEALYRTLTDAIAKAERTEE